MSVAFGHDARTQAKEGQTMNPDFWIELLIIVLRIVSAGFSD